MTISSVKCSLILNRVQKTQFVSSVLRTISFVHVYVGFVFIKFQLF